jgi:uncharacterized protein
MKKNSVLSKLFKKINELPDFQKIKIKDVNAKGFYGNTPLHIAATWGDIGAIKVLIEAGADLNAKGEHGYTPLHEAVEQNWYDAVKLLVEHGCSLTEKNDDRLTPVQLAESLENDKIIFYFKGL